MVDRKRKRKKVGDWHHRVPDFQLVYCGPKTNVISTKEESDKNLKKKKQYEKVLQQ